MPLPADWPPAVEVSGYWWPARPEGWQPPRDLVDFLAAGPPPVFIGFGSMAPDQGERLSRVIEDAVTRAGVRAVVQAGWAGLTGAGDRILAVGDLSHDWVFPQVAAVVHHAGAGTTGAALRAGVPAVPVPGHRNCAPQKDQDQGHPERVRGFAVIATMITARTRTACAAACSANWSCRIPRADIR
jgi:UDP:flavonoid glycosyltransferase YjiC (YdhE family)